MEKGTEAAAAISAVLCESITLYHLDLSYNSLAPAACAMIAEGLRGNHHLYGLHFVGNAATMDANGFLQPFPEGSSLAPPDSPVQPPPLRFGDPRNSATARLGRSGSNSPRRVLSDDDVLRERDVLEHQSACWACEGWERVDIVWPIDVRKPEPKAVWAFTSLDGFQAGMRLKREGQKQRFSAARMVPPGYTLLLIFQVDSGLYVAPGMESRQLDTPAEIELRACEDLPQLHPPSDQDVVSQTQSRKSGGTVEHRIVLRLAAACVADGSNRQRPCASCDMLGRPVVLLDGPGGAGPVQMPRTVETGFKMLTKSTRSKPFFATFKRDTDMTLQNCFQMDWSRAKVGRLVEEKQRPRVQEILQANYKKLLSIYRVTSAMGVTGATGFGVSQIEACDTIAGAGLVDSTTRIADVDRLFIAAKVMPVDMKRSQVVRQDKSLVRHQFIEFLLRLADQRYVQAGITPSIAEALSRVLDSLSETGKARTAEMDAFFGALHTDAVDAVYKRHLNTLLGVYQRFSGRLTPPGLAKFMCLAEFQELLERIDAHDETFTTRRSAVAFRMGMMTQAEESFCSRFQEMTFVEFQHALGAVVFLKADANPIHMDELVDKFFSNNLALALPHKASLD